MAEAVHKRETAYSVNSRLCPVGIIGSLELIARCV